MALQGQGQQVAFRDAAARNRTSKVYSVPWTTGGRPQVQMHNDGYLAQLNFWFNLTVTIGTAGTVTDAAAGTSNFCPFMGIKTPDGDYIWSTNSRDLYDWTYRLYYGINPSGQPGAAFVNYNSATAQALQFTLPIPISLNDGLSFDVGMLMRQLSNVFFTIELQLANFTDLVGAGSSVISSITGNIFIGEVVYDAVDPNANPPVQPPSFSEYVQLRSLQSQTLQNGSNDLSYAIGPVLTDMMLRIINNGSADGTITNVSYVEEKINQRQVIEHRDGYVLAVDNYLRNGQTMRAGMYHLNWFDDAGALNTTLGRDFINSNKAAQLDTFVQYAGTPSGTSFVGQFFRELVAAA